MPTVFDSCNEGVSRAIVFTVPHAGRDYPAWLVERLAVTLDRVAPLEDRLADLLVAQVAQQGWQTIVARQPRLLIDLNRAETDFMARAVSGVRDPAARPSHRARGGLGLVPDRLGSTTLWRAPLTTGELAARIASTHRVWHAAVEAALARARDSNGIAILVDVHSMPPLPGFSPAQVVIGNRHGASAPPDVTHSVAACFRDAGLRVALNAPYAGAHMLERHGHPARGISAIQVEIDRRLYLDPALDRPGEGMAKLQGVFAELATRLEELASRRKYPLAAE